MFAEVRQYILEGGGPIDHANSFIGQRQRPLLGEMLPPGTRPDGWRAHVLCAEIRPGTCLAHVQTFVSEDWPTPAYTVRLGRTLHLLGARHPDTLTFTTRTGRGGNIPVKHSG